ncbi:MAG: TldD/PmbA family protein [Ruminococcaceae bacterium]|nr:TldD/PmbA family protein [Oscillospiraceae bacterium]
MKELNSIAAYALSALSERGADSASVSAAYVETREFNVDGGEFSLFRTMFDNSLVLTALRDGKKGSAAINHFDNESIINAANSCIAAADASGADKDWEFGPDAGKATFVDGVTKPEMELFFSRCRELVNVIKQEYPKIIIEQLIVSHRSRKQVYINTNGSCFDRYSGSYSLMMMFSAHENGKGSSFFGCGFNTADLSVPFIEQASLRRDLASVEKQIHTKSIPGKFQGTVLVPPGCLGEILYYALGTFADGAAVNSGTSIWKDKLGERVADERLNISLSPCCDDIISGSRWTSDGYLTKKFDLIKNGVLQCFVINKYFANKTGVERSLNYSLENLAVGAGDKAVEEIIKGIDKGLLLGRISGGRPSSSGDFSMVAKNSFIIENGKIGDAVSEVMINGNLAEMLNSIRNISLEKECDGGTSLPWISFDGITISGK